MLVPYALPADQQGQMVQRGQQLFLEQFDLR
jgi:hypothetical protein